MLKKLQKNKIDLEAMRLFNEFKKRHRARNKGYVLIFDRKSIPAYTTLAEILKSIKEDNIVFYEGEKPRIVHLGGNKNRKILDAAFLDTSSICKPL